MKTQHFPKTEIITKLIHPMGNSENSAFCIEVSKFEFSVIQWADVFTISFSVNFSRNLQFSKSPQFYYLFSNVV